MTETVEQVKARTVIVDEFLAKYSAALPTHIVDFALDVRAQILELEDLLGERMAAGV